MAQNRPLAAQLLTASAVIALGLGFVGCSSESNTHENSAQKKTAETSRVATGNAVQGTVKGTDVTLAGAEFDGQLAIYEGDGWGFSPSLLIFLFLDDDKKLPENQTFSVSESDGFGASAPHVHYRWRDPESGDIDTQAVMSKYNMQLTFGEVANGKLPGQIDFSVPGEKTRVQGAFIADIGK